MFECTEELSKEMLEKIKELIKTDVFKEINDIVHICDLSFNEEMIIKNIKDYIWSYIANHNSRQFPSSVYRFMDFFNAYQESKEPIFTLPTNKDLCDITDDLLIVCNGYHIYQDFRFLKNKNANGFYSGPSYLGSNHQIYLSKKSMLSKAFHVSSDIKKEVDYNPIIGEEFFKYFEEPVASYYLLHDGSYPFNIILSKSFLKPNQELIHLSDMYEGEDLEDTHLNRLKIIKSNLALRYKDKMDENSLQELLDRISLEYAKQTFLKLLIGPMDSNYGNTALLLTHHNSSLPEVNISPAYDLDISFHIASELSKTSKITEVMDENQNAVTLNSLIKDFKDIPGFNAFIKNIIQKISSNNVSDIILQRVYQRTNLEFFKHNRDSYMEFLNERFKSLLQVYRESYLMEDKDESILGR